MTPRACEWCDRVFIELEGFEADTPRCPECARQCESINCKAPTVPGDDYCRECAERRTS